MVKREMKGIKSEKDKQKNVKKKDKSKGSGEGQGQDEVEKEGEKEKEEEEEEGKGGDVLYRVLEARQLAIKLLANVTCKYCMISFLCTCSMMV